MSHICLLLFVLSCHYFQYTLASQAAGTETLVAVVGEDFVLVGADSSVSQSISLTANNMDKIAILSEPFVWEDPRERSPNAQQTILAAAAGDAADADRLIGLLQAHATMQEYKAPNFGCDVEYPLGGAYNSEPGLTVDSMASLARGQIAASLRNGAPMKVCLLIAGMMPYSASSSSYSTDNESKASALSTSYKAKTYLSEHVQRQIREASWESKSSSSSIHDLAPSAVHGDVTLLSKSLLQPGLYWLDEYGSCQKLQYGAHGFGANFILSILDQGYKPGLTLQEATKLLKDCFQQLRTRYIINSPQPPCIKCVDAKGCRLIR